MGQAERSVASIASAVFLGIFALGTASAQAVNEDEFAQCSIQGPVKFCLGRTSVDSNSRLKAAVVRFKVTSLYGTALGDGRYRGVLESVPVKCEFYRADGSVAGWGSGGVGYLEHGETIIGRAVALKVPDAVSARCIVEQRFISYRSH